MNGPQSDNAQDEECNHQANANHYNHGRNVALLLITTVQKVTTGGAQIEACLLDSMDTMLQMRALGLDLNVDVRRFLRCQSARAARDRR